MPSYDWRTFAERPLYDRFPEWAHGYRSWRGLFERRMETLDELLDDLVALRGEVGWGQGQLTCPRIFVSHRRCDGDEALEIARIANKAGDPQAVSIEPVELYELSNGRGEKHEESHHAHRTDASSE